MDDNMANTIEIAVIKEQISGIREQQKAHAESTTLRFDKMDKSFDGIKADIAKILQSQSKNAGFWAAFILISGFLGAIFSKAIAYIFAAIMR